MFSFLSLLFVLNLFPNKYYQHQVFFKNSDFELNVYRIYGEESGKTVMILGGIQGDEPAGYMAADTYTHLGLKKGNLIIVPRADFASILLNKRQINADMNRRFSKKKIEIMEDKVVKIIKSLMKESDYFINLHEGSGFYSSKYVNKMRNPKRYGQSVIIDAEKFYSKKYKKEINLKTIAEKVIQDINKTIHKKDYFFHLNNHRTIKRNTIHPEQRNSATYYAVYTIGLPSFAIETSKMIGNLQDKIKMHVKAINSLLKEFGIEFSFPYSFLKPVSFEYLIVLIDGEYEVLHKNDVIHLNKGSILKILALKVKNKESGVTADLLKYGAINDLKRQIKVERNTNLVVRSDSKILASIPVIVGNKIIKKLKTTILLNINGQDTLLSNGQTLDLVSGSKIFIRGASGFKNKDILINFVGYAGKQYSENDIGQSFFIPKALMPRFAIGKNLYEIYLKYKNEKIFRAFIKLVNPKIRYVIFKNKNNKLSYLNGETLAIKKNDKFHLFDIISDVDAQNIDITLPCGTISFDDAKSKDIADLIACGIISKKTSMKKIKFYLKGKFIGYLNFRIK